MDEESSQVIFSFQLKIFQQGNFFYAIPSLLMRGGAEKGNFALFIFIGDERRESGVLHNLVQSN